MPQYQGIEIKNLSVHPQEQANHLGKGYSAGYSWDIPSGETVWLLSETGNKDVHLKDRKVVALADDNSVVSFEVITWENVDPTFDTDITIFNNNRNLDNGSTLRLNAGDEATADTTDATELTPYNMKAKAERRMIATSLDFKEYIEKRETFYALEIINKGDGDIYLEISWEWFETEINQVNWN